MAEPEKQNSRPRKRPGKPAAGKRSGPKAPGPKKKGGPPPRKGRPAKPRQIPGALSLKQLSGNRYCLVPPRCAVERDLDLEEVQHMRDEDEPDVARDELLFLVEDCRGFLEAYNLLAELALEQGDIPLAQGYYGFGYESAMAVLPIGFRGLLPAEEGYNPHFFLAGRGLARCLISRGDRKKAREILKQLHKFDPDEPDVKALLDELEQGPRK